MLKQLGSRRWSRCCIQLLFDKLYGLDHLDGKKVNELLKKLQVDHKTRFENSRFTNLALLTGQRKLIALIVALIEDCSALIKPDTLIMEYNPTKRTNRNYTAEFKQEAVVLVIVQGHSVSKTAASLSITDKLLYNWKAKTEAEQSGASLNADERAELLGLCKENNELRMEKEILKKASALLLKETK